MEVSCNLHDQWIQAVRDELGRQNFQHSSLDDLECAIRLFSWRRRTIKTGKREVKRASSLAVPSHLQAGLAQLDVAFESGLDLHPWHSKLRENTKFEDGMLNDFGVAHFHLGQELEASGYIERTKELLFCVVTQSEVYEIGIYDHGEWFELDILDIVDREWPELLDSVTVKAMTVTNPVRSREDIQALRMANVNTARQLSSGRIVMPPGGGMAMDGTSTDAVMAAQRLSRLLKNGEKQIVRDITDSIERGKIKRKDYTVVLTMSDHEIYAETEEGYRWTLE
ncbi:hypothetical protein [Halomonas organivorans]|uniref:Uncharacterized protein n=1 Tax=Halomonas organivorans TaxID=257772 RepID=A0A7W5BVE4_9GAMM|nr:hypothetical protein [Halomonas organivorans]MBB3139856.1 hypothetical protein [Halomonas organivorans]